MGKEEINLKKRGQIFALISVVLIIGLCSYAFYLNFPTQAATIATVVIVGLAGVFVYNRKQEQKENKSEQ